MRFICVCCVREVEKPELGGPVTFRASLPGRFKSPRRLTHLPESCVATSSLSLSAFAIPHRLPSHAMSTLMPRPEQSSPAVFSPPAAASSRRLLACVVCQRRKVKCDRKFPCAHCVRACAQCVPATLAPRQRRRRFPERELLERLRRYEGLLRQNNIKFEPLHTPAAEKASPSEDGRGSDSPDDAHSEGPVAGADRPSREKTTVKSETVYKAKLRFP